MDRGAWWTTVHGVAELGTTEQLTLLLTDHKVSEVKSLSHVRLFATPWTLAYQAPPSMGFSRQEYWSGVLFPSARYLPNPGIEPGSLTLQADTLPFRDALS